MVELTWMNSDAQAEVNMFLRATEMNPSQISLGGFFNVNRNLFKSVRTSLILPMYDQLYILALFYNIIYKLILGLS